MRHGVLRGQRIKLRAPARRRRGWQPKRKGRGRWGLFMEPSSLVCGFPDIAGKSFEVAKYTPEGGRLPLLKVTQGGIVSIGGRVAIGTSGFGTPTPREQLHVIGKLTEIQELNARLERLANLMNPKNGGAK